MEKVKTIKVGRINLIAFILIMAVAIGSITTLVIQANGERAAYSEVTISFKDSNGTDIAEPVTWTPSKGHEVYTAPSIPGYKVSNEHLYYFKGIWNTPEYTFSYSDSGTK